MYYNNKLGFYLKQYGTQIIVGIVCCLIVASSLFVYFKINNKTQNAVVTGKVENEVTVETETITQEDETTILSNELLELKAGNKATVKVATVDDNGVLLLVSGDKRIKAKMIGVDVSRYMPDTIYTIDQELCGNYVDIAFDETKVLNGYAMVYVYANKSELYNAKLLREGRIVFDTSVSKKAIGYNELAESQAYAKQTLAGVWGE